MSKTIEIERKFLVETPEIPHNNIKRKLDIIQTYLTEGENGSQRRVRKISENSSNKFIYTEKIFYSPVIRKETESEISEKKYNELLKQARTDCSAVIKKRICFDYLEQYFELDIYPFSDTLSILELELDSPAQEIKFPEYIRIIKEVSSDSRYSNAALCTAGEFPTDAS